MSIRWNYQTTKDRDLRKKQMKFPKLTQQIYVQNKEVKQNDGFALIEPSLDPERKAHELHLIKKTGSVRGEPWWVRKALQKLGFVSERAKEWQVTYTIQPNTSQVNNQIWLCKHLVKLLPVTFKNGFPTEADLGNTRLNLETGEFEIFKKIDTFEHQNITCYKVNDVNVSEQIQTSSSFGLEKGEIQSMLTRQRQLNLLNDEFFPAKYDYKYDQDKKGVLRINGRPSTSVREDEVQAD